jgi:hypothetical protein
MILNCSKVKKLWVKKFVKWEITLEIGVIVDRTIRKIQSSWLEKYSHLPLCNSYNVWSISFTNLILFTTTNFGLVIIYIY